MTDMLSQGFRFATSHDVPAIRALVESAYRGDVSKQGWTTEADLLEGQRIDEPMVHELLGDTSGRILLLEGESDLLACAHLQQKNDLPDDDSGYAYFGMFSVAPGLQGQGIGDRVLAEAERMARDDWHLPKVRMTVIAQRDALIAWYQRRGYAATGEQSPFPYGDKRFGIPKRDDLYFIVLEKPLQG